MAPIFSSSFLHILRSLPDSRASKSERAHRVRGYWSRPAGHITLVALALAATSASLVAVRLGVPPTVAGITSFCLAWVALYPIARLNRLRSWWVHWVRGAVILVVLWLLTR